MAFLRDHDILWFATAIALCEENASSKLVKYETEFQFFFSTVVGASELTRERRYVALSPRLIVDLYQSPSVFSSIAQI